jgi:hypothetical protein
VIEMDDATRSTVDGIWGKLGIGSGR